MTNNHANFCIFSDEKRFEITTFEILAGQKPGRLIIVESEISFGMFFFIIPFNKLNKTGYETDSI
jgi:hypothetical protein